MNGYLFCDKIKYKQMWSLIILKLNQSSCVQRLGINNTFFILAVKKSVSGIISCASFLPLVHIVRT